MRCLPPRRRVLVSVGISLWGVAVGPRCCLPPVGPVRVRPGSIIMTGQHLSTPVYYQTLVRQQPHEDLQPQHHPRHAGGVSERKWEEQILEISDEEEQELWGGQCEQCSHVQQLTRCSASQRVHSTKSQDTEDSGEHLREGHLASSEDLGGGGRHLLWSVWLSGQPVRQSPSSTLQEIPPSASCQTSLPATHEAISPGQVCVKTSPPSPTSLCNVSLLWCNHCWQH